MKISPPLDEEWGEEEPRATLIELMDQDTDSFSYYDRGLRTPTYPGLEGWNPEEVSKDPGHDKIISSPPKTVVMQRLMSMDGRDCYDEWDNFPWIQWQHAGASSEGIFHVHTQPPDSDVWKDIWNQPAIRRPQNFRIEPVTLSRLSKHVSEALQTLPLDLEDIAMTHGTNTRCYAPFLGGQ